MIFQTCFASVVFCNQMSEANPIKLIKLSKMYYGESAPKIALNNGYTKLEKGKLKAINPPRNDQRQRYLMSPQTNVHIVPA